MTRYANGKAGARKWVERHTEEPRPTWCLWCGDDVPIEPRPKPGGRVASIGDHSGPFCREACRVSYNDDAFGFSWVRP